MLTWWGRIFLLESLYAFVIMKFPHSLSSAFYKQSLLSISRSHEQPLHTSQEWALLEAPTSFSHHLIKNLWTTMPCSSSRANLLCIRMFSDTLLLLSFNPGSRSLYIFHTNFLLLWNVSDGNETPVLLPPAHLGDLTFRSVCSHWDHMWPKGRLHKHAESRDWWQALTKDLHISQVQFCPCHPRGAPLGMCLPGGAGDLLPLSWLCKQTCTSTVAGCFVPCPVLWTCRRAPLPQRTSA